MLSFVDAIIESSEELEQMLQEFIQQTDKKLQFIQEQIFIPFEHFNLDGIWMKRGNLKKLSNAYLENWSVLDKFLPKVDEEGKEEKGKTSDDIVNLQAVTLALKEEFPHFMQALQNDVTALITTIQQQKMLLEQEISNKNLIKSYLDQVLNMERIMNYFSLIKGQGENKEELVTETKDTDFYTLIEAFYKDYTPYKFYNAVRNFLTKKPFSLDKIKINFEN
ncbi:MAG: hypothetical protein LBG59_09095 [Candidatus Peribacteria bacterium]|jgi:hypothetical protein|nr:hypothetical protein [Candidatus Peribacteria bacterium]